MENKVLTELSIIKNTIFNDFKLLELNKNYENQLKKDDKGNIVINCLNSFLWKIKKELLIKGDDQNYRSSFNLKFDCLSDINQYSENLIDEIEQNY